MTNQRKIRFIEFRKNDADFLFELLLQRSSKENISHKNMPTHEEHIKFIMSKPYYKWYIVKKDHDNIGAVYLTQLNEIGISLVKRFDDEKTKNEVLELIMKKHPKKRYIVNINPKNKKGINFFKKRGFRLIQYSYEYVKGVH